MPRARLSHRFTRGSEALVFRLHFGEVEFAGLSQPLVGLASIPDEKKHSSQKKRPHSNVGGVIDQFVRRSQTIAGKFQSSRPAVDVEEEKNKRHDHAPRCRSSILFAKQETDGH